MAAVRGELEACNKLGVAVHGRQAVGRVVVVDTHVLVCTAGRSVDTAGVEHHLGRVREGEGESSTAWGGLGQGSKYHNQP